MTRSKKDSKISVTACNIQSTQQTKAEAIRNALCDANGDEVNIALCMLDVVHLALLVALASEILYHRIKPKFCEEHKK